MTAACDRCVTALRKRRLYYDGSVAKGLFALDCALPRDKKVLLVGKQTQLKVDARPKFTDSHSSLEVLRTYVQPHMGPPHATSTRNLPV